LSGLVNRSILCAMDMMTFWKSMDNTQRERFAGRAGTTVSYIRRHLVRSPPSRVAKPNLIAALVKASNGKLNKTTLYKHFYEHDAALAPTIYAKKVIESAVP